MHFCIFTLTLSSECRSGSQSRCSGFEIKNWKFFENNADVIAIFIGGLLDPWGRAFTESAIIVEEFNDCDFCVLRPDRRITRVIFQ